MIRSPRLAAVAAFALLLGGLTLTGAQPAMAAATDDVASLTNAHRANAGVRALDREASLDRMAQEWADHMSSIRSMQHSGNDWRISKASPGWSLCCGENIAYGYTTAGSVVNAWMGSTGHRANILDGRYTHIGVGYSASGHYWVQVFATYSNVISGSTPSISGDARVGHTLTATAGSWTPSPVSLAYQWLADGGAISGATQTTLAVGSGLAGKTISVRVTGTRSGYTSATRTSAATGAVTTDRDWVAANEPRITADMNAAYSAAGGANVLGNPTSAVIDGYIASNGGGVLRSYERAVITWRAPGAAVVVAGSFLNPYTSAGGPRSSYGWPASTAKTADTTSGSGVVQGFQFAAMTKSPSGRVAALSGDIRTAYNGAGGLTGPLGWPGGYATCSGGTCSQEFGAGSIIDDASSTRFDIPAISSAYDRAGASTLGTIVSGPNFVSAAPGGFVMGTKNAAVVWSPKTGAAVLSGGIRSAYSTSGGLSGSLGWPTSDRTCSNGCWQSFERAVIGERTGGAAAVVSGRMLTAYLERGGPTGSLGLPTGGESSSSVNGGGSVQGFEKGAMTWTAAYGVHAITGDFRTYFGAVGGLGGQLGWVATDQTRIAANGGGIVQGFQGGAIASSSEGMYRLTGQVRATYNANGGVTGALGWPTGEQRCSSDGACSQSFQNGVVSWSPSAGGKVTRS